MYGINYDGLKKRETYDEIVDYIQNKQDTIKYPDRTAKQIRNSPQISNLLDGDGDGYLEMENNEKKKMMQAAVATELKKFTMENNKTLKVEAVKYNIGSTDYGDLFDKGYDQEAYEQEKLDEEFLNAIKKQEEKDEKIKKEADDMLKRVIAKSLINLTEDELSDVEIEEEEEEPPVAVKEEIERIESFIESTRAKPKAKARSVSRKGTRLETVDPEKNIPRRSSSRAPERASERASGSSSRPDYEEPPASTARRRETKDPNKKSYYTQMNLPDLKKIAEDLNIPLEEKGGEKITKNQLLDLIYEKKNIL